MCIRDSGSGDPEAATKVTSEGQMATGETPSRRASWTARAR